MPKAWSSLAEIESLFSDSLRIGPDISHSQLEQRFRAIDQTANRRHIFVVFMFRHQEAGILIRPISAHYMHKKEVEAYEKAISSF